MKLVWEDVGLGGEDFRLVEEEDWMVVEDVGWVWENVGLVGEVARVA